MKLLFLLLFSIHYPARDHKVNEKKQKNWILPTVTITAIESQELI